ncbi:MAG: M20/M25/M40 family metallo-hydrolase [Thermoplasmata archaeon]|nr:MAG: M20/M25/M40 family metallo-hydrolase [Thermoplasmata archaeon]
MTKKIKISAFLLIIIIIIAAVGVYAFNQIQNRDNYRIISFDSERAYNDVEALISIGPRLSGTDEEYRGAVYIKRQFEEAGLYDVHIEDYEVLLYEVNFASVSLIHYLPLGTLPNPMEYPVEYMHTVDFVVQGYSGSYEWSSYSDDLEMIVIEDDSNDGEWEDAQDKAAIITGEAGWASNTELFFKASDFGVAALILHRADNDLEMGHVPISKSTGLPSGKSIYPDIPFFMVSEDMGDDMKEGINSGMKLRLNFDVIVEMRDTRVVLGDVRGSEKPEKFVMLGGHHDTVYNGPGAVDNTVGTVTVIELARQLARTNPKRTIRLATWGGEEEGLWGSRLYNEAHEEDVLRNCMSYLNFDMNNIDLMRGKDVSLLVTDNGSIKHMEAISSQLMRNEPELKKYNVDIIYYNLLKIGSDHLPFLRNGIDVAASFGSESYEYHTYLDNIDHVNTESLSVSGRIFGSYALYLADK